MRSITPRHVIAFCLLVGAVNYVGLFAVRHAAGAAFYTSPAYLEYLRWRRVYSSPWVIAVDLVLVGLAFWWVARKQRVRPNHPAALVVLGIALGNLLGMLSLLFVPL